MAWAVLDDDGKLLELDLGPKPLRTNNKYRFGDERPVMASPVLFDLAQKRPDYVLIKDVIRTEAYDGALIDGIAGALGVALKACELGIYEWAPHTPVLRSATRSADFPAGRQVVKRFEIRQIMARWSDKTLTEPEALAVAVARFGWDKYGVQKKTPQSSP